ncbi:GNAT family N-acetyltransferase [Candidatus Protochlamydia sp. W-9]|uniref:GNAT family N-acetyltransferase n=1 Tax=Candidatus Protochlamydia sp. W-9 TaxID=1785087 RepID=UPI00096A271A|nr:GNAT family N-acetyltransferase [Candidatus Protochlamydia sp. W-9]
MIHSFSIKKIPFSSIPSYLIVPATLPFFNQFSAQEGYLVPCAAFVENEMVGCAVAQVFFINQTAQLYSLFVKEEFRKQGLGFALFQFLENDLKQENKIYAFGFEYEKNDLFTPAIEKILSYQQWLPPKLYLVRCHFDAYTFDPPWIHLPTRLPSTFKLFSWQELTLKEKEYIQYKAEQGQFLPSLSPFKEEEHVHLGTSVGLRYLDTIIGWCITHSDNLNTIRYNTLYIDHAFLHSGYGIQILNESIRRHKRLPIPQAIFEANIEEIDRSWLRFIKKRLIPLSYRVERLKWAFNSYV